MGLIAAGTGGSSATRFHFAAVYQCVLAELADYHV